MLIKNHPTKHPHIIIDPNSSSLSFSLLAPETPMRVHSKFPLCVADFRFNSLLELNLFHHRSQAGRKHEQLVLESKPRPEIWLLPLLSLPPNALHFSTFCKRCLCASSNRKALQQAKNSLSGKGQGRRSSSIPTVNLLDNSTFSTSKKTTSG